MKHLCVAIAIAVVACFVNQGHGETPKKEERLFYYVNTESAFKSLQEHIDQITILSPKAYDVDAKGTVWGSVDPRVVELAREHGVRIMPLVKNMKFNQELLHKLLSDSVAVGRMLKSLLHICTVNKFVGIQFDFEDLNISDRNLFTNMCRRAAEAFHKNGLIVTLAVVPRSEMSGGTTNYTAWIFENWRGGYDLKKLAGIVDFMSVMTYGEHTPLTTPGPAASIPWVKGVIDYFLKYVPAEKLSLGIPLYSRLWYTAYDSSPSNVSTKYAHSTAMTLDYDQVQGTLEEYKAKAHLDEMDDVNYAILDNDGLFEYLYIENAQSFGAKLGLVKKYDLRGFSAWVLGSEDPGIWKVLK